MNKFKKSEIFATLISNLFLFLILYLFPFQSKCQSIVYINNSQYGISGNMVFKADTLGNTNWVMDFSGKIVSALSDTNHLQTIASDGKLIYLTSMQTSGTGILQYYPANIVMDTNGMVRAIWYNHISPGGGYSISASVGTTTNGAWIFDDYSPGITHHFEANYIDSNGVFRNGFEVWRNSNTYFGSFQLMSDSSYLLSNFSWFSGTNSEATTTKINIQGYPVWKVSVVDNFLNAYAGQGDVDSLNNTVVFFGLSDNVNHFTMGVILNPSGVVLATRVWPLTSIYSYGKFQFVNGGILYDDGTSSFDFNYQLLDSCLGSGVSSTASIVTEALSTYSGASQLSSSFTPVNHTAISVLPYSIYHPQLQVSPDYCLTLESDADLLPSNTAFNIYSNPIRSNLEIVCENKIESGTFKIINTNGCIVKSGPFLKEINVEELVPGIYFLEIQDASFSIVRKFIKQ